jgi:class 3 adenylate cyclase
MLVVVVGLGVLNLGGGWVLLRPLGPHTATPLARTRAGKRLRLLPSLSAAWGTTLVATFIGGHHLLTHNPGHTLTSTSLTEFLAPLGFILAYAALLGLFLYFTVGVIVVRARRSDAWLSTLALQARGRLGLRVLLTIIATSVVPLSLAIAHREADSLATSIHAMDFRAFLVFDLAASLLAIGSAVAFFLQSLTQPIGLLMTAMNRFQNGDFSARAMPLTDDEIGGLAIGFNEMAQDVSDRAFVNATLGRFVPEAVAAAVLRNRGVILPRTQEATILYSDIEGFTTICERLDPTTIMSLLNKYFGALSRIIRTHSGVITQFQGDAMLVTFNLPVADPEHARNAVRAAMDIEALLCQCQFAGGTYLPTRIGINTGVVVGGTIGDDTRLGYTVHGDAVNVAQRLEQANKKTGTNILISASTAGLLGGSIPTRFLATVDVSGREKSIDVYTPQDAQTQGHPAHRKIGGCIEDSTDKT